MPSAAGDWGDERQSVPILETMSEFYELFVDGNAHAVHQEAGVLCYQQSDQLCRCDRVVGENEDFLICTDEVANSGEVEDADLHPGV